MDQDGNILSTERPGKAAEPHIHTEIVYVEAEHAGVETVTVEATESQVETVVVEAEGETAIAEADPNTVTVKVGAEAKDEIKK